MNEKEKAKELVERMITASDEESERIGKQCALICVDEKYNSIIYVLGELKARGELSAKMYLKSMDDLNNERQGIKTEIELL